MALGSSNTVTLTIGALSVRSKSAFSAGFLNTNGSPEVFEKPKGPSEGIAVTNTDLLQHSGLSKVTLLSEEQSANGSALMTETQAGSVTLSRPLPLNARFPINSRPSGSFTLPRETQFSKVLSQMPVREGGKSILSRPLSLKVLYPRAFSFGQSDSEIPLSAVQPEKVSPPSSDRLPLTDTLSSLMQSAKAPFPTVFTVLPMLTSLRNSQPLKASAPIFLTPFPIDTRSTDAPLNAPSPISVTPQSDGITACTPPE